MANLLKLLVLGMVAGASAGFIAVSKEDSVKRQAIMTRWSQVTVQPPAGAPPVTQHSIDLAMVMYGIEKPATAAYPLLNAEIEDRGLSTRRSWKDEIIVEIGPAAFASWGLLGSTLAHELEVHCNQSFLMINILDNLGFDGTSYAERDAYLHELRNAKRFGLTAYSQSQIANTMEYYYSLDRIEGDRGFLTAQVQRTIGQLLAAQFVKLD